MVDLTSVKEETHTLKERVKVGMLILLEWMFAALLVTVMKNLVSNPQMNYPYPLFATSLANVGVAVFAFLLEQTRRAVKYASIAQDTGLPFKSLLKCFAKGFLNFKPRISWHEFKKGLLPVGVMVGVETALANWALQLLTISLKTMVAACSPATVLFFAWAWNIEGLTMGIVLVLVLIVGGGWLSAIGSVDAGPVSMLGLAFSVGALVMQGFRFVITQVLLKKGCKFDLTDEDRREVLSKLGQMEKNLTKKLTNETDETDKYSASPNPRKTVLESQLRHDFNESNSFPLDVKKQQQVSKVQLDKVGALPTLPKTSVLIQKQGVFTGLSSGKGVAESVPVRQVSQLALSKSALRRASAIEIPPELKSFVKTHIGSKTAHITKIEIMALTSPLTSFVCLVLAVIYEPDAFGTPSIGWAPILGNVLLTSVMILAKMVLDLALIQQTSAFVFSLVNVVHNLMIVLAGVAFFGDRPPALVWLGFFIINAGIILYAWLKTRA